MKSIAEIATRAEESSDSGFTLDTTFVLFFIALELGRCLAAPGLDTALLGLVLALTVAAPYLFEEEQKLDFGVWVAGRVWIAGFAVGLGVLFNQLLGTVLPEMLRFAPMGLLIVSAILSCYIQFYRQLRVRA